MSNRLEMLAEEMAHLLRQNPLSPLDASVVLIQSRGMEKWLSMQIAMHNGICANMRFLFPNAFIYELFNLVLEKENAFLDVEQMKWRLMKILPELMEEKRFSFLKRYLRKEKRDLSLFQLSTLIADTFDQYIIFRPEMMFEWEKGKDNHWQAELFRLLIKEADGLHRAKIMHMFIKKLSQKKELLPSQIYVFGISAIPKFHMDIIYAVSEIIDVHMFLMNPCRQYWGDIIAEKYIIRVGEEKKEELHMEKGNPLLSSLGKVGRDFFDIINEYEYIDCSRFQEIEEKDILSYIQSDILNMRDPELIGKREIKEDDFSIQIHSCHSPMRELEVLYDRLVDMFQNDPDLKPRDIIVMTPDIEKYAPYIQAVFGSPDPDIRIPFSIADRSSRWENKIINTFFKILELKDTRIEASKVIDILESEPVSRKFNISLDEIELIRIWVRDSGIRWGIDKENRQKTSTIYLSAGTWDEGIKSLVLGYALLDESEGVFEKIFPYDSIEGKDAELLGRFVQFLNKLFGYVKEFYSKKRLTQWRDLLFDMIDSLFFVDEENQTYIQMLRNIISDMAEMEKVTGFNKELDLDVLIWNLEKQLSRRGYGSRFMTGGITFCAMLPMRSIPFKIICLVGMNYDLFPRHSSRWEFDLIQKYPRKGDRSKRDDDRYLFLETILSARKILYISYTGQSIKDNSTIPPSVVVSELIDYIEQRFYMKDKDIIEHICYTHPLHSFSPVNFKGNKFFSYSENSMKTAQIMLGSRIAPEPFLKKLPQTDEPKEVDIKELCDFFSHPCRFLLKRLGITLPKYDYVLEDKELLELKGLDKYIFEQKFLDYKLGNRKENFIEYLQTKGLLPFGSIGEYEFRKAEQKIDIFVKSLDNYIDKERKEIEVELPLGDILIRGKVKEIYSEKLFLYRFGKIRAFDRINIWLNYLLLLSCEIPLEGAALMGLDDRERIFVVNFSFLNKDEAKDILKDMLRIFKDGLQRAIHFFPLSSWRFCESRYIKGEDMDKAIQRAKNEWEGNDYRAGEGNDDYYQFCFRGEDPIDEEFIELSKKVFLPIILNVEKNERV